MHKSNSPIPTPDSGLTLNLPQLLAVSPVLLDGLRHRGVALPALEALLSRGQWEAAVTNDGGAWPQAALALLGEGGQPGDAYLLRVDPVHLQADQDHLLLWDSATIDLTESESRDLVAAFNAHFGDDGLSLERMSPDRWYLRLPDALEVETRSPLEVSGRNLFHFMPSGPDRSRLEQLINETQMLFHDHPVNHARREAGQMPVSGIWPWGGGRLSQAVTPPPWSRVMADDPIFRGLAIHHGLKQAPLPADADEWAKEPIQGQDFLHLEQGGLAARMGDEPAWLAALEALERDWFQPLSRLLLRGQLKQLRLQLGALGVVVLSPWGRRRFWRRRVLLPDWIEGHRENRSQ
ncbi:hypothetical protein [Natronospira bacteriovora]|uniref:Phosphoglycerate mutase n=1 Tax=Natronospira bacteriovora TaxID=3069753 RepID=A0ABU0W2X5_9GAMM|nr:hypothetical protein [Natronospira sp. AB-CW4]MDQ2068309.1 hypothetical protein [Natronospira sp. AB-CW4]